MVHGISDKNGALIKANQYLEIDRKHNEELEKAFKESQGEYFSL